MKKLLVLLILFVGISFIAQFSPLFRSVSYAAPGDSPTLQSESPDAATASGTWVQDPEVTFVGQLASRSGSFLNWTLTNYKWGYNDTTLGTIWVGIRNTVFISLILTILIASGVMIVSGGSNITVLIFTKKFILALLFISFSYAIVRLSYQLTDIIQNFFIHNDSGAVISTNDLLNVGFNYQTFIGYKKFGLAYNESAFMSLLLIKLTSITYYAMTLVLLLRKVILWFFIVVSPLYPLINLYFPIKNAAKYWVNEFFRWLFYAPLFTIFLSATVTLWKNDINILPFDFKNQPVIYPTSINILIGGPGQTLSLTNSVNYIDTFAQYVVALLMLWMVIILPFILLQIVLQQVAKIDFSALSNSNFTQNILKGDFSFLKGKQGAPILPSGSQPTGSARELPRAAATYNQTARMRVKSVLDRMRSQDSSVAPVVTRNSVNSTSSNVNTQNDLNNARTTSRTQSHLNNFTNSSSTVNHISNVSNNANSTSSSQSVVNNQLRNDIMKALAQVKPEVAQRSSMRLVSFPVPSMHDIVNFETAHLSRSSGSSRMAGRKIREALQKIHNPDANTSLTEKREYSELRDQLVQGTTQNDPFAKSVLEAASVISPEGDGGAANKLPTVLLPTVNEIQIVTTEDYQTVRNMWLETYETIDIPEGERNRQEWINHDIGTIAETLRALTSEDPLQRQEGLNTVASVLPFILIGGFSQDEVVGYLKAKSEAAQAIKAKLEVKKEDDDELLTLKAHHSEEKTMAAEAVMTDDTPSADTTTKK